MQIRMKLIRIKETTGNVKWVNLDHVTLIDQVNPVDLTADNFAEGDAAFNDPNLEVYAVCVRGPNGWWKILTREQPSSIATRDWFS